MDSWHFFLVSSMEADSSEVRTRFVRDSMAEEKGRKEGGRTARALSLSLFAPSEAGSKSPLAARRARDGST